MRFTFPFGLFGYEPYVTTCMTSSPYTIGALRNPLLVFSDVEIEAKAEALTWAFLDGSGSGSS